MSTEEHRRNAPASVRCLVVTISDTRTEASDTSGDAIAGLLAANGHEIPIRTLVKDDDAAVQHAIRSNLAAAQVVITTGGTGLTSRDSTYEAISQMLDKRIDGFGELFRSLSFQEIGAAAMLSRACAGSIGQVAVFALPGSEHAVRLAMTRLILPEIGHIVRELNR